VPTGTALLDFGAFPGSSDTSLAVADAAIASGSKVEAWVFPADTTEHNIDEHLVDPPRVVAARVEAGVGFTIYGFTDQPHRKYGQYNVAWAWV
jgi:hypothetical protein